MRGELDPVEIRLELELQRAQRTPWRTAWLIATGRSATGQESHILEFMEKHFRAAYHNTEAPQGRCGFSERDTHEFVAMGPPAIQADGLCRSGDGCDRPATRGRFRPMWCDRHGAELERFADTLTGGKPYVGTRRQAA